MRRTRDRAYEFGVITLAAYRLQRLVTTDDWPPSERFREIVAERFGPESAWYDLVTCPWCIGSWITFVTYAVARVLGRRRSPYPPASLEALAAAALVGLIAQWESTFFTVKEEMKEENDDDA